MNMIFGLLITLSLSTQVWALEKNDTPPFSSIVCKTGKKLIQIQINSYRQTYGAGPAEIVSKGVSWTGGWHWTAVEYGTRLYGSYHLTVKASAQECLGSFYLHTLYNSSGELSFGWVEMAKVSATVECHVKN